MKKINMKISLCINILITLLTIIASIIMFTGFKFMHGHDILLESTKIGMLKFFTVESNIFIGIVSLIFAIKEIQILKGHKKELLQKDYILKLMATSAVGLTFFIVFVYLGPISKDGIPSMLMNSNLFFHLIIPVVSILNFVLFEKSNEIKFKHVFYGVIPTLIYGIYYIGNILIHMENGMVSTVYDWYWFVQNGVWTVVIVVPIILGITYLISLIIWKLNKKTYKGEV